MVLDAFFTFLWQRRKMSLFFPIGFFCGCLLALGERKTENLPGVDGLGCGGLLGVYRAMHDELLYERRTIDAFGPSINHVDTFLPRRQCLHKNIFFSFGAQITA